MAITDREYSRYRASHEAVDVVDENQEKVVLRTPEGNEEELIRPRWILNGVRPAKQTQGQALLSMSTSFAEENKARD